jgi:hypothetical protein
MDPVALIGAGSNVLGGAIGGKKSSKAAKRAQEAYLQAQREMQARLDRIDIPTIEAQELQLEIPELVGLLEAEELGPSALEDISLDPRLRDAQMTALQAMSERGVEGLSDDEKAMYQQMLRGVSGQEQARQESILQGMAQRGALDSGAQLAAQLASAQSSADRASQESLQMAADAAQARRDALQAAGQMGNQLRKQDYEEAFNLAGAQDRISKFNLINRQDTAAVNLAARQAAEKQRADILNREQTANKALLQQQFKNEMSKATGQNEAQARVAGTMFNQGMQQAQNIGQSWSNIGSGVGKAFSTMLDSRGEKKNEEE